MTDLSALERLARAALDPEGEVHEADWLAAASPDVVLGLINEIRRYRDVYPQAVAQAQQVEKERDALLADGRGEARSMTPTVTPLCSCPGRAIGYACARCHHTHCMTCDGASAAEEIKSCVCYCPDWRCQREKAIEDGRLDAVPRTTDAEAATLCPTCGGLPTDYAALAAATDHDAVLRGALATTSEALVRERTRADSNFGIRMQMAGALVAADTEHAALRAERDAALLRGFSIAQEFARVETYDEGREEQGHPFIDWSYAEDEIRKTGAREAATEIDALRAHAASLATMLDTTAKALIATRAALAEALDIAAGVIADYNSERYTECDAYPEESARLAALRSST